MILEKKSFAQLVKKSLAFCGKQYYIAVCTKAIQGFRRREN